MRFQNNFNNRLGVWHRLGIVLSVIWIMVVGFHSYLILSEEAESNLEFERESKTNFDNCQSKTSWIVRLKDGSVVEVQEQPTPARLQETGATLESPCTEVVTAPKTSVWLGVAQATMIPLFVVFCLITAFRWVLSGRKLSALASSNQVENRHE